MAQGHDDLRSLPLFRTQHKLTPQFLNAFLHSEQTQALMFNPGIESGTVVSQFEADPFRGEGQLDAKGLRSRVLDRVGE